MIKALVSTPVGRKIALLGLTRENVTRLEAQDPMFIDLADLGLPPQKIMIICGETPNDITNTLRAKGLPVYDQGESRPVQTFEQRP